MSSIGSIMELSPSQTKKALIKCFKARLVPFLQSSPGMGKSSLVKEIAKEWNLELVDLRLSTMEPTDLTGLPHFENGRAVFEPYAMFPLEDTPIPEGKDGWLLFLDEFNAAPKATQAAAYRLVLDREVGQHKLHPNCIVAAAGNLMSDNAITTRLSTAMLSRVIHIHMKPSFKDWLENVALPEDYDERVIAYLSMYKDKLMQFDPEREDETFCAPRTWEFCNRLIKGIPELSVEDQILLSGTITPDIATEFVQFTRVYQKLVTIDKLKAKPEQDVPEELGLRYATLVHMMLNVDDKSIDVVAPYVSKFDSPMRIMFLRSLMKKNASLLKNQKVKEMWNREAKYIYES